MPGTRPPYPQQFREQMIALLRSGRSIPELAEEFQPSAQTIVIAEQADLDDSIRSDELTTDERKELRKPRKENRRLQQERDILSKAAAAGILLYVWE